MQKITLMGNLGKDAQVRESSNGRKFVSLVLAANSTRNGEQKTAWYNIVWFNFNQNVVQYLTKGKTLIVGGDLDADIRIDQNGSARIDRNVFADYVTFPSGGQKDEKSGEKTETPKQQEPAAVPDEEITTMAGKSAPKKEKPKVTEQPVEDDLPF